MRQIIWESNYLEYDTEGQGLNYHDDDDDDDGSSDPELEEQMNEFEKQFGQPVQIKRLISTPMGVFDVDFKNNPYYNYKFWTAHTNFSITKEVQDVLDKFPGVEVLRIISRYRFIIAVGQAFEASQVRKGITDEFCKGQEEVSDEILDQVNNIEDEGVRESVTELIFILNEEYIKWLVHIPTDGECQYLSLENGSSPEDIKEYEVDRAKLIELAKNNGQVIEQN